MEQKLCRTCGELKDVEFFYKDDKMISGYRKDCKKCTNKLYNNKERRKEFCSKREIKIEGTKICKICKNEKDIEDFCVRRCSLDGRSNICKECSNIILKKYKESSDYKEKRKKYDKIRYEEKKQQILKRKKEYHVENKEDILKKKKEYRQTEEYKIINKKWWGENRDLQNSYQIKYREKYPHIIAWRSVLYSTLKRLGTKKETHTIDMLGYSALELKEHIEKQFLSGMTWDNHGEWHIDHIKPVTSFSNDALINEVCSLKNLQPLWKFDNLSKSNKTK